jgi:hypothetical protein
MRITWITLRALGAIEIKCSFHQFTRHKFGKVKMISWGKQE